MTLILMKYDVTTRNNAEGKSTFARWKSFQKFSKFSNWKIKLIKRSSTIKMQERIQKTVVKKTKCTKQIWRVKIVMNQL